MYSYQCECSLGAFDVACRSPETMLYSTTAADAAVITQLAPAGTPELTAIDSYLSNERPLSRVCSFLHAPPLPVHLSAYDVIVDVL